MNIPPGACDCHVHVFGPAARYPFAPDRAYTPPDAPIDDLLKLQERLGFERVVIVQPSVYGTDNACTLDALKTLARRARAVAVIDSRSDLGEMQSLGVRGVRVNLQTGNLRDPRLVAAAAARVATLGWHVQAFARRRARSSRGRRSTGPATCTSWISRGAACSRSTPRGTSMSSSSTTASPTASRSTRTAASSSPATSTESSV